MAQLSGKTATVKYQRGFAVPGQLALQLFKLAVGDADGRGDMAFVIFGFLGPRIDDNGLVTLELFGHIFDRNCGIVAFGLFPGGEAGGKNLNVSITEFFRLPGGFVTQLSGGAATIKDQQRILIFGQLVGHFVELAARNVDGRGDMPVGILGLIGPRINDHDAFGLGHGGVWLHERRIHDVVKLPVGFDRLGSLPGAGTSKSEYQNEA